MTAGPVHARPLELTLSLVNEAETELALTEAELELLAHSILTAESVSGRWDVTVALVSDERLQSLHHDFLGIDAPTDIMTFPIAGLGEENQGGELVISIDHARLRSREWGHSAEGETRFLVAHGLLHLLGWRDERDDDRDRMLARQSELLAVWEAAGTIE